MDSHKRAAEEVNSVQLEKALLRVVSQLLTRSLPKQATSEHTATRAKFETRSGSANGGATAAETSGNGSSALNTTMMNASLAAMRANAGTQFGALGPDGKKGPSAAEKLRAASMGLDAEEDTKKKGSSKADKRAHHNALERKRRDHIKDSFTVLRDSIPQLHGEKSSRAQILNKATDYIQYKRKTNLQLQRELEALKRDSEILAREAEAGAQ